MPIDLTVLPILSTTITCVSTFTTVSVVNPAWTTNTVVTTTSPGGSQPTVVPVLIIAAGVGIVMFGLPAIKGAEYFLPGLEPFEVGPEGEPGDEGYHSTISSSLSSRLKSTSTITGSICAHATNYPTDGVDLDVIESNNDPLFGKIR